jgi:hypothetical protein
MTSSSAFHRFTIYEIWNIYSVRSGQALKPGGYFFLDEFIGPSRFQWTDVQLDSMNDGLDRLPKELRRRISDRKKFKERVVRETVQEVIASDPSEAIRSSEIVPLLGQQFEILETKGFGERSSINCCMTSQEIFAKKMPDLSNTYGNSSPWKTN